MEFFERNLGRVLKGRGIERAQERETKNAVFKFLRGILEGTSSSVWNFSREILDVS